MHSISTKTGDKGESGLANGVRLPKSELVFEVLGSLDELNSWLGVLAAEFATALETSNAPETSKTQKVQTRALKNYQKLLTTQRSFVLELQDTLFYIGAELAGSPKARLQASALTQLEKRATKLQTSLEDDWTTKFLLPGGSRLAAQTDVARAVCRRVERVVVQYSTQQEVAPLVLQYLNRLSDYLYILRCALNSYSDVQEKQFIHTQK